MTTPYIILREHDTPNTQQANAATLLFDHVSHEAGRQVWEASTDNWKDVARKYVNIHYWPKGSYKQSEFRNDGYDSRRPLRAVPDISRSMANHPAGKGTQVNTPATTRHPEATTRDEEAKEPSRAGAMGVLLRFLGR